MKNTNEQFPIIADYISERIRKAKEDACAMCMALPMIIAILFSI